MYFINTFNELAFSSEVSAELPKINRSINSVSGREGEREKLYYYKTF